MNRTMANLLPLVREVRNAECGPNLQFAIGNFQFAIDPTSIRFMFTEQFKKEQAASHEPRVGG